MVSADAQQSVAWFSTVLGAYHEETRGIHVDAAGNSYGVAISYADNPVQIGEVLLFKHDSSGTLIWSALQATLDRFWVRASARSASTGRLHVAGRRVDYATGSYDIFTSVFDGGGALLWTATYAGPLGLWDDACAVFVDAAGNTYVAGTVDQDGNMTAPSDMVALKYSPSGQLLWSRTIDDASGSVDLATCAALDANGDFVIAGRAGLPVGGVHAIGARFSPAGNVLWEREWRVSPLGSEPWRMEIHAGLTFLGGNAAEMGYERAFAQALDASGAVVWTRILSAPPVPSWDQGQRMTLHPDGGLVLGVARKVGMQPHYAHIARIDAGGAVLWERSYTPSASTDFQIMQVYADVNGRVTLCGHQPSGAPGVYQSHVQHYDVDGIELWNASLPLGVQATHLVRSPAGPMLVAGWFQSSGGLNAAVVALDGPVHAFCAGDGSIASCPCGNDSAPGMQRGCVNSIGSSAQLLESGNASLQNDTLGLTSRGELAGALTIFLQGSSTVGLPFGDGLLCAGGSLKTLYVTHAVAGVARAPEAGAPTVSQQSALLGDPVLPGDRRYLQACYRDPNPAFCAAPMGNTWNVSSGIVVEWLP
jgi:hypothetical protein